MYSFAIKVDQPFERLANAPIVEAVLDFRVPPISEWDNELVTQNLKTALPDYPQLQSQRAWQANIQANVETLPVATTQELGWHGVLARNSDGSQVAQFQRSGFAFSRLKPYLGWLHFQKEALRLWDIYQSIVQSAFIVRIGLRSINRIDVPSTTGSIELDYWLTAPPTSPPNLGLPHAGFYHTDTYLIPGTSYTTNLIRTIDTSGVGVTHIAGLIIDIDVFSDVVADNYESLIKQLDEMRWVKNKLFFSTITPQAKVDFQK